MQNTRTILLAVVIGSALLWMYNCGGSTTVSRSTIPYRFHATWKLIEDISGEVSGVYKISLSARAVVLEIRHLDEQPFQQRYTVQNVDYTTYKDSYGGSMVVAYVDPDDADKDPKRFEIWFGETEKLRVSEIVPTGWGEDRWFEVGEFVRGDP